MLKASRGESKIPICRILNLCLQPSGIVVAWDSDLPLFLLSPYLTHLPLWLPHWHMNAIFHPSSFLPSFVPSSLHLVSSLPLEKENRVALRSIFKYLYSVCFHGHLCPNPRSSHTVNSFPSAQMAITSMTHILSMVEIIIFVI